MENNVFETVEQVEPRIAEIVERAKAVAADKLKPANRLIADVKQAMSKGLECVTVAQLQEWALAIPIICEELVPYKEAFVLMKDLWDIETKQLGAKNLLELDEKKTKIEIINRVSGTEHAKRKAISSYVQSMIGGTQESLWMLGHAVRKILDARIASGGM